MEGELLAWLALLACSPTVPGSGSTTSHAAFPSASSTLGLSAFRENTARSAPAVLRDATSAPEAIEFSPSWPNSSAALEVLPTRAPRNLPRKRIYLMAGHANGPKKYGNLGVHGQAEADVNHDAALDLAERLRALDRFDVVVGREGEQQPSYRDRIRHAEKVGADVFIELHTDSRGNNVTWADSPRGEVLRSKGEDGFSILYSERGPLRHGRRDLAQAIGESLGAAGFKAYPGCHYGGTYDATPTAGVFIDRRGLMMLRKPSMPSIIIETHNAKDYEETLRWREAHTSEAFASAIADGLQNLLDY